MSLNDEQTLLALRRQSLSSPSSKWLCTDLAPYDRRTAQPDNFVTWLAMCGAISCSGDPIRYYNHISDNVTALRRYAG
jgi:hypothetical protein